MASASVPPSPALSWLACLKLAVMSDDELAVLPEGAIALSRCDIGDFLSAGGEGLPATARLGTEILNALAAGDLRRSGLLKLVLLRFIQTTTTA